MSEDQVAEAKKCENGVHYPNQCQCTVATLRESLKALTFAARTLRNAQRAYMTHRGNQELGKAVAVAAKELDRVLGDA